MSTEALREEYVKIQPVATRFCLSVKQQIEELLSTASVTLGVPLEFRVKPWESIVGKIERGSLELATVRDLGDLVGLRLILLFKRDLASVCELMAKTFVVISQEDTSERLLEAQFGYQSLHYGVKLPEEWMSIPSFREFGDFKAELQIRTIAQHMWAAASHELQYKQEEGVPRPVRRSIYRVSALLETVDLEFERVLAERDSYLHEVDSKSSKDKVFDESLNVDNLSLILDALLPAANKDEELYSELLPNLLYVGIDTSRKLDDLIAKQLDATLARDAEIVAGIVREIQDQAGPYQDRNDLTRTRRGVFYTFAGLVRTMMDLEFGEMAWIPPGENFLPSPPPID